MYISDETIEKFIKEDVQYADMTTLAMGFGLEDGIIRFSSRHFTVLSGTEEVARVFEKLNIRTTICMASGTKIDANECFLEAEGRAESLHMGWKVALNILEYSCGIATRTHDMVLKARVNNRQIPILSTRKSFPGTKELSIKAVISGGGFPHRMGISESILIFKQHLNFVGGYEGILNIMPQLKLKACEKKIIVEAENEADAMMSLDAGVDGIQFDKIPTIVLSEIISSIRKKYPAAILLAAGGVNQENTAEYAKTGVDGIVTSAVYFGKPADIKAEIVKA